MNDKIYDWLLVNDPEVMADPDVRFEIIPNEEEFIRQLNEEIEAKEKQNTDRMERNKSPKQEMGGSLSPRKKECIIY